MRSLNSSCLGLLGLSRPSNMTKPDSRRWWATELSKRCGVPVVTVWELHHAASSVPPYPILTADPAAPNAASQSKNSSHEWDVRPPTMGLQIQATSAVAYIQTTNVRIRRRLHTTTPCIQVPMFGPMFGTSASCSRSEFDRELLWFCRNQVPSESSCARLYRPEESRSLRRPSPS